MVDENERRLILEMVQSGKISADQGLGLLKALAESGEALLGSEPDPTGTILGGSADLPLGQDSTPGAGVPSAADPGSSMGGEARAPEPEIIQPQGSDPADLPPRASHWRRWWMTWLWAGVGILILGGWLMYWAQITYGIGFLFFCAWLPFLLGLALIVLAWQSSTSRWLHLRVQQRPGSWPPQIAISLPLPVGLASWFLRTFRGLIPGLDDPVVNQVLTALEGEVSPENPIYIDVEDNPNGEHVQIFIG